MNIFGGIMRCDIIAEGVVAAVKEIGRSVPLVVRLEGTNVEIWAKRSSTNSGLNPVIAADNLKDGADEDLAAESQGGLRPPKAADPWPESGEQENDQ